MTIDEILKVTEVLTDLISKYPTMRQFARTIREETSDVSRWKSGAKGITTRALIEICRLHPEIKPYELRPDTFPKDLEFVFKKGKEK